MVSDSFSISEGELTTKIYVIQGLDLVVEQTRKGKEKSPAILSHYSNPGLYTYASLLKFLQMHGQSIPMPSNPAHRVSRELESSAQAAGVMMARMSFPVVYRFGLDPKAEVKVQPMYQSGHPPELDFVSPYGTVRLGPQTIRFLATQIPKLYARPVFAGLYRAFQKESKKIVIRRPKPKRGRQLVFDFMKPLSRPKRLRK